MPTNIVHVAAECPRCGHAGRMAWEFAYGALAGEELELGQRVPFDEAYSFYRRSRGVGAGLEGVEATALCPSCDGELRGRLVVEDGVLSRLEGVRC